MNVGEIVEESAKTSPDRIAVIFGDESITYAELDQTVNRVANGLIELGVKPGDRVAIQITNRPQFIQAFYGVLRAGGTVVPVNVMYKVDEIAYLLEDSGASLYIVLEPFYPLVAAARERAPGLEHIVVVGQTPPAGTVSWARLAGHPNAALPGVGVEESAPAVICYTSGTTGRAKGAVLTHHNLVYNCQQCDQLQALQIGPDDRALLVLPLFHIYALNVGLNLSLYKGAGVVLMERFEPLASLEAIEKHGVSVLYAVPPMYIAWLNTPGLDESHFPKLRIAVSGAAALPVSILERFQEITGVTIWEGYGLTEVSPVATSNSAGPRPKPGTIGLAVPGMEARVVDDNDEDVPRGQPGELILRGENVMLGYWHRPEDTAEAMQGGWFHTGDIVTQDEDGYFTIVDRKKDMINVGGMNVYPREVEELLYRHPKVAEAAVLDYPDPYQGECVMAVIVPKPDAGEIDPQEIIDYCRERIAVFKAPRKVVFRESLPRNLSGKVVKRELREQLQQTTAGS